MFKKILIVCLCVFSISVSFAGMKKVTITLINNTKATYNVMKYFSYTFGDWTDVPSTILAGQSYKMVGSDPDCSFTSLFLLNTDCTPVTFWVGSSSSSEKELNILDCEFGNANCDISATYNEAKTEAQVTVKLTPKA